MQGQSAVAPLNGFWKVCMSRIKKLVPISLSAVFLAVLLVSAFLSVKNGVRSEWQSLTISGSSALKAGQNIVAEGYFSQALRRAESENDKPNEEELIVSLQNLGLCCERERKYDDAARLYMRMAAIAEGKYGARSPEYQEALAVLKQCSLHSTLLQKCPKFTVDEHNYSKI